VIVCQPQVSHEFAEVAFFGPVPLLEGPPVILARVRFIPPGVRQKRARCRAFSSPHSFERHHCLIR
jgi:hypothetical protein